MKKFSAREKLLDTTFTEVYMYGYCGASTANILKKASVPKGSMYHHFKSKKKLVIAMLHERLIPKVENFFDFKIDRNRSVKEILSHTFEKMSENKMLIKHGCPLQRIMFELGSIDEEISNICHEEFQKLSKTLQRVIEHGNKRGEFEHNNTKELAEFIIISTWGILSRAPKNSSKEQFLKDTSLLLRIL